MRHRVPIVLLLLAAVACDACAPSPKGPSAPAGPDQVSPQDAVKAAGARAAAIAFVNAYANAANDDAVALAALVGTPQLRDWVRWIKVEDHEFQGTISGSVQSPEVGPAAPFAVSSIPGSENILRQVDVRASVTFAVTPDGGTRGTFTRSLDGPMRLLQDPQGHWVVVDFTRDGIAQSAQFQMLTGKAQALTPAIRVQLDSFEAIPAWQFGLIVAAAHPLSLAQRDAVLVSADGSVVARSNTVSESLTHIRVGATVAGVVLFDARSSADGLTLRLTFRSATGAPSRAQFSLPGLIKPIAVSPSASPSA